MTKKYTITHEDDTNDLIVISVSAESPAQAREKGLDHLQRVYPSLTRAQLEQDNIAVEPA
jgi:hypothetical protein